MSEAEILDKALAKTGVIEPGCTLRKDNELFINISLSNTIMK